MTPDPLQLLVSPYVAPQLRRGDRAFCLYRDADVVVTSWTDAPVPWPRCRALHQRGGSGLLVNAELRRAILTESAIALMYWFGVGANAVWAWRRAFGVSQFGTDGSRRLHRAASERGAATLRDEPLTEAQVELRRATARRLDLGRFLPLGCAAVGLPPWTEEQVALLGTMPDAELAAMIGRTERAVRVKRSRRGIPTYHDRRRKATPAPSTPALRSSAN